MGRSRLELYYLGRVQGVGFRYTVKRLVRGYDVVGTVRNLPDGRVELLAEGERSELEDLRKGIQDSEVGHFIRQEEANWCESRDEFSEFEIVR